MFVRRGMSGYPGVLRGGLQGIKTNLGDVRLTFQLGGFDRQRLIAHARARSHCPIQTPNVPVWVGTTEMPPKIS